MAFVFKIKNYLLDIHVWFTLFLCAFFIFLILYFVARRLLPHYSLSKIFGLYIVLICIFWTAILINWVTLSILFRKFVILCVHGWVEVEYFFSDTYDLIPRFLYGTSIDDKYSWLLKSKQYLLLFDTTFSDFIKFFEKSIKKILISLFLPLNCLAFVNDFEFYE